MSLMVRIQWQKDLNNPAEWVGFIDARRGLQRCLMRQSMTTGRTYNISRSPMNRTVCKVVQGHAHETSVTHKIESNRLC